MEQRIKELTGKKLQNLTISTFHALGVKILREYIDRLGYYTDSYLFCCNITT